MAEKRGVFRNKFLQFPEEGPWTPLSHGGYIPYRTIAPPRFCPPLTHLYVKYFRFLNLSSYPITSNKLSPPERVPPGLVSSPSSVIHFFMMRRSKQTLEAVAIWSHTNTCPKIHSITGRYSGSNSISSRAGNTLSAPTCNQQQQCSELCSLLD